MRGHPVGPGAVARPTAELGASLAGWGFPVAWAFLLGHRLVMDILVGEATSGGAPRAQGARVIGDEGLMELWDLHRDGVSAVSGRGPVDDAPEERGYFLRRVARAAVGRLVDDAGKGERTPGVALLRALADRDLQGLPRRASWHPP